ncbi:carbon-nitrogen hydrolase family protein [Rouxiella sp. Mn2063]|uniref:carbon-nitrogen hydrolase family protein n=1 Tax=Rouxiella sp. Mn2063 TaxID=3395262 RepID=UPI003BCFFC70
MSSRFNDDSLYPQNTLYPHNTLRVAVAQAEPVAGNIEANVQQAVALIRQGAEQGAKVILLPEKFLSGYEPALIKSDPQKYAIGIDDVRLEPIVQACRNGDISAIVGTATLSQDKVYISSLCFNARGEQFARYHKRALFSSEVGFFSPGEVACSIEVQGWKLGLAVCYDSAFPEHARSAALEGCHAYLVSALFSQGNGYHESRIWMPARALDNTIYVLMSNHVGRTGGWQACGSSAVWGPYGNVLSEANETQTAVIVADLDPSVLKQVREGESMLADFATKYAGLAARP